MSDLSYPHLLGIDPPDIDHFVDQDTKLFHLVILALIERSGPMALDELVKRLGGAGVGSRIGDLGLSIQKAWHGMPPVVRGKDGRFDLDLKSQDLRLLLWQLGLEKPRAIAPPPELPPPPPEHGDHEPLTEEEVKAVMGRSALSALRQTAAILDLHNRPMTVEEIDAYAKAASQYATRVSGRDPRSGWRGDLLQLDPAGKLTVNRNSDALIPMRRAVRKLARARLIQQANSAYWAERQQVRKAELEAKDREDAAKAAQLRRAVLRIFTTTVARAATLVNLTDRSIRTFLPDQIEELSSALEQLDVLIGLDLRADLVDLGLSVDRWRLIDLSPPKKSMRLNRTGRTLKITTEMLISSSISISRALGDPKKLAKYLKDGDHRKFILRLQADAKHLATYYAYGVLHNYVRLRWGFLNERLYVPWALPGDPDAYDLLQQALGQQVDVVLGWSAPGWEEPWARARCVTVVQVERGWTRLDDGSEAYDVPYEEIQAVRLHRV